MMGWTAGIEKRIDRRRGCRWLPVIALLLLSACGNLQWPPPGPGGAPVTSRPAPERVVVPIPADGIITVRRFETLFQISKRYNVAMRAIIDANDLRPPYILRAGSQLKIPVPRLHRVARGDTLYGISRQYDVSASELAMINDLAPPYRIFIGQELRLPAEEAPAPQVVAAVRPQVRVEPEPSSPTAAPRFDSPADKPLPPRVVRRTPTDSGGRFAWPVTGDVASNFGPKGNGLHNDGINILAPPGTPVQAAESGVVTYAGNELRGFGNLLLIKHPNGWVTAYAHNEALLVKRGQKVKRGDVIARVGSSGNVVQPQLHFEIRKGSQAIDPTRELGPAPRRS